MFPNEVTPPELKKLSFRLKVCGITTAADVAMLAKAGVEAVGINFVPSSPRCVSTEHGSELAASARQLGVITVAVVMNSPADDLQLIMQRVAPDLLQLHGDEVPDDLVTLGVPQSVPIIKSVSWSGRAAEAALAEKWRRVPQLAALLVDAYAPGVGGGTGRLARWDLVNPRPPQLHGLPIILAGGLKPDNVADAIASTHPDAVDTASGVEAAPGRKDAEKVAEFAKSAKAAFEAMECSRNSVIAPQNEPR